MAEMNSNRGGFSNQSCLHSYISKHLGLSIQEMHKAINCSSFLPAYTVSINLLTQRHVK